MRFYVFLPIILLVFVCCNSKKNSEENKQSSKQVYSTKKNDNNYKETDTSITLNIFKFKKGWAYEISEGNKKLIYQPHIPSIEGIKSFQSKTDASKIGNLAKKKIMKGIFPPTINKKELDSLNIKY